MFRFDHRRHRAAAVVLRLLVMLSLWQAPVVWGHEHAPDSTELAAHVLRFHGGNFECCCRGWHWHLSLPEGESPAQDGDHAQPVFPKAIVTASGDIAGTLLSPAVEAGIATLVTAEVSHTRACDRSPAAGFLASFCPAHSPQQVLCRLSC